MSGHWTVLLPAILLDLILGDPHWMPHPVRWMGAMIAGLEKVLRSLLPKTPGGERLGGILMALLVGGTFCGGSALLLWGLALISPWLAWGVEVWLIYQLLAARALERESMAVYPCLIGGDLPAARTAVSRIVGRDTQSLDEAGVAKAAVETVAENTCDGVVAPLNFLWLGGLPLGMLYKAVSTMDSMVGYRNARYQFFGWAGARLDDLFNLIPARLAGLSMCLAAAVLPGYSGRGAFRVFLRDRKQHKSPNSAHTEAACAGALGIQLAGDASYGGKLVKKPTLGDPLRPVEPQDIPRACRLMYADALVVLALLAGVNLLL